MKGLTRGLSSLPVPLPQLLLLQLLFAVSTRTSALADSARASSDASIVVAALPPPAAEVTPSGRSSKGSARYKGLFRVARGQRMSMGRLGTLGCQLLGSHHASKFRARSSGLTEMENKSSPMLSMLESRESHQSIPLSLSNLRAQNFEPSTGLLRLQHLIWIGSWLEMVEPRHVSLAPFPTAQSPTLRDRFAQAARI